MPIPKLVDRVNAIDAAVRAAQVVSRCDIAVRGGAEALADTFPGGTWNTYVYEGEPPYVIRQYLVTVGGLHLSAVAATSRAPTDAELAILRAAPTPTRSARVVSTDVTPAGGPL